MEREIVFETAYLRYVLSARGENTAFIDKSTGRNVLCSKNRFCGKLTLEDKTVIYPVKITYTEPFMYVEYENGFKATVKVGIRENYLTFSLEKTSDCRFWSLEIIAIQTDIDYAAGSSFVSSCMGMSLNTRMAEYPGRNSILSAEAFTHIGIEGVKCAVIGAPETDIIDIMKEVLDEIPDGDMPKGAYSGPYAFRCKDAMRTYTIGGASGLEGVDQYVQDMKKYGITQVHMHQGQLYTQGVFNVLCKNGEAELKAMIDRYHELGVQVMLHTYAFFVDSWGKKIGNKYIAPIPHKDLGVCATFTLADDVDETASYIPVKENTRNVREVFGYVEPAAPFVWIDDELIRFKTVAKFGSYGFDDCERGALGTRVSEHKKGATVRQINSYFGYIAPEKNSELFFEIARNTAQFYNEYDFDGFYLDAIDGVFVLDGNEFTWYHAVLFINELFKYLKKPPIFNCCYGPQYPGQWYARSRMGAFDSASRGYRDFTDAHVAFNEKYAERMYLTGELGWWSLFPPVDEKLGWQNKVMFDEDVDYICSKMLATDVCMCWHGSFANYKSIPMLAGYSDKIMLYTNLKENNAFSEDIKSEIRKPGAEFDLVKSSDGAYRFRRTMTQRKRVESVEDGRNTLNFTNCFKTQKPKIRIEALYSTELYDSSYSLPLLKFDEHSPVKLNRTYEIGDINMNEKRGLNVWLYGDGKGETVNIRLRSPDNIARGYADYFIKVDFTGWRNFSFYEFQNCEEPHEDWAPKQMEYKVFTDVESFYAVYRSLVDFNHISAVDLIVNKEGDFDIRMKPVMAVPHRLLTFINPSLTVGGKTVTFETVLKSNTFLEYDPKDQSCFVYDMTGNILDTPNVTGHELVLKEGDNQVTFNATCNLPYQKRAAITLRTVGEVL